MKKTIQTLLVITKTEIEDMLLSKLGLQTYACKFDWVDGDVHIVHSEEFDVVSDPNEPIGSAIPHRRKSNV